MKADERPDYLEVESPWFCQPGVVRVPVRPGENPEAALEVLADREGMSRPYIFETPYERRLHFTQDATQSAMSLLEPDSLIAPYTRKMMAFLLLNPNPRHVVMVGLGGGSLAKFCYRHLPKTRITVVEIDEHVIAMRDEFLIPRDDERFRVVHDDGARYLEAGDEAFDVLLVDAFDADGVALSLVDERFHRAAARRLAEGGVIVTNLWGKTERYSALLKQAARIYGSNATLVPVSGELNLLLFASRRPPPTRITDDLETIANWLQRRLELDFPRYLRVICQGHALVES